jgi:hypothetical protein
MSQVSRRAPTDLSIVAPSQAKQLDDSSRRSYALLVVALASRDSGVLRAAMQELGVAITHCGDSFRAAAGYILFDTRMDIAEARMSPLDPQAPEFRWAKR